MKWEVEFTEEFGAWWDSLVDAEQESIRASVLLLGDFGPNLRFPHSSGINYDEHLEALRKEGLNDG